MRIGVDLISGESGIKQLVGGCIDAIRERDDIEVAMIGKREIFEPLIEEKQFVFFGKKNKIDRLSIIEASQAITMEDHPLKVIKEKKDSSIVIGLKAHKNMEIDAFYSPGNTGAIVVAAALIMGRTKGVKKPALAAFIPNVEGNANMLLDVGASAECEGKDLVKFAVMGSIFFKEMEGVEKPTVGLLNIGSESHKGTQVMKDAYEALSKMDINFIGNIEGNDIFSTKANVIVADGSLGNTTLKVAEAAGMTMVKLLKKSISKRNMAKLALPLYKQALRDLRSAIDPESHGGAPLLGVNGNIFIGHGSSGRKAIKYGILAAAETVRRDMLGKIHRMLENLHI